MKNIKTLLLIVGMLSTSITAYAEDYALIKSYPLLGDMKTLSQQQVTIEEMKNLIKEENKDTKKLKKLEKQFNQVLIGLAHGDKEQKLKGTNISELRTKLSNIQNLSNRIKTDTSLAELSMQIEELNELYKKSYLRYKQRSILSSIVKRHMHQTKTSDQQLVTLNFMK